MPVLFPDTPLGKGAERGFVLSCTLRLYRHRAPPCDGPGHLWCRCTVSRRHIV